MKIPFLSKYINEQIATRVSQIRKKGEILAWDDVPEVNGYYGGYGIMMNESPPPMNSEDYLRAAKGWVYTCVTAISDEVATIKFHLYRKSGDKVEEIVEHELLDLLNKVNDFTTKFDLFSLTQQYLELSGEAPWLLDKGEGDSPPTSIYLLRPDKITIKFSKDKIVDKYIYDLGNGKKETFEADQIIFLKYTNPLHPLRGRGTLEAAVQTVQLDDYGEKWNLNFFYNSARPDAILTTTNTLTDEQRKSLYQQWRKNFGGLNKTAKMAILEGGLDYKQMQLTQKDMDFLEQQRFSRDKILSIFRVPKTVVAISDDVNRANAETGAYSFARWNIRPKMMRLTEQLNEFLVPLFGDDLYLEFEDPVQENFDNKIKGYESGIKSGYITINEVRDLEGLKPVENGDVIYLPVNLVPIGSAKEETGTKEIKKVSIKKEMKEEEEKEMDDAIKNVIKAHLGKNGKKKLCKQ